MIRRSTLMLLLPLITACGGAPFVAGDFASMQPDSGAAESATPDGAVAVDEDSAPPPPAPTSDSGPKEGSPMRDDAGVDAAPPTIDASSDAGAAETGAPTDPVTYACGTKSTDGTAPVAASLQWWASVSVQQVDGSEAEDYCSAQSLGTTATYPYTCEGISSVWTCAYWQGTGGTLGCHVSALDPSVLQIDCWIP